METVWGDANKGRVVFRREESLLKDQRKVTGRPRFFRDSVVVDLETVMVDQGTEVDQGSIVVDQVKEKQTAHCTVGF